MANEQSGTADAPIAGKVCAVTGAAGGMGGVMARALAAAGADIAAIDMNTDGLDALGAEPSFADRRFVAIQADVSKLEDCRAAVQQVVDSLGGIDVLVNCAGVSQRTARPAGSTGQVKFYETDPEGWTRVQIINAFGAFYMAHAAVPHMLNKGWGRIINVTTSYDTMLREYMNAYGPSKSSLESSTVVWSKELAGTGITVNVLTPGGVTNTPFLPPEMPRDDTLDPSVMEAPVQWLASDASADYTGCRFIGRDWDKSVAPDEAAKKLAVPAAWADLAAQAEQDRGAGKI
jgi:NAD(P)-dependent dehydrogenase (short-subunit alcohol dehydrogenase family)